MPNLVVVVKFNGVVSVDAFALTIGEAVVNFSLLRLLKIVPF